MFELAYINEEDRALGLAGMAISLASLDALDRVSEIFLDSEGPMVDFNHNYYLVSSPAASPKSVWNHILSNFHLTTSLVMSNVMARSLVRLGEEPGRDVMETIRSLVREEGAESCSLDEEEADMIFNRSLMQSKRLFLNARLYPAIRELADVFTRRRRLSAMDLAEELDLLRL